MCPSVATPLAIKPGLEGLTWLRLVIMLIPGLSKSHITSPKKNAKSLFKHPAFFLECFCSPRSCLVWRNQLIVIYLASSPYYKSMFVARVQEFFLHYLICCVLRTPLMGYNHMVIFVLKEIEVHKMMYFDQSCHDLSFFCRVAPS